MADLITTDNSITHNPREVHLRAAIVNGTDGATINTLVVCKCDVCILYVAHENWFALCLYIGLPGSCLGC